MLMHLGKNVHRPAGTDPEWLCRSSSHYMCRTHWLSWRFLKSEQTSDGVSLNCWRECMWGLWVWRCVRKTSHVSLPLVKGIVHPKMKFTHPIISFQTFMIYFLLWYTKEDILKKVSAVFVCITKEGQKHWIPLSFIVWREEKDIERERKRESLPLYGERRKT